MADTKIEWTDKTWNPLRGCRRVSPGCQHCYAERMCSRVLPALKSPTTGENFAIRKSDGAHWTGKVEFIESALDKPLRWRKPSRIFVNSMSDLFHESVPDEWIDRIFAVMALCPQHTFQCLTKRPERMCFWMQARTFDLTEAIDVRIFRHFPKGDARYELLKRGWPLPNVWLGVSVEDQQRADERIPWLLKTPAAVRFVSAEPLLAPVDLYRFMPWTDISTPEFGTGLDLVIIGGESGPGARTCDVRWIRDLVRQCKDAGVAAFVKQIGANPAVTVNDRLMTPSWDGPRDSKGEDMTRWPHDICVRQMPEVKP